MDANPSDLTFKFLALSSSFHGTHIHTCPLLAYYFFGKIKINGKYGNSLL